MYIGEKINNLTIESLLSSSDFEKDNVYQCRCDCGRETMAAYSDLISGVKTCCEKCGTPNNNVLQGKRFGSLVVVGVHSRSKTVTEWNCNCDCGAFVTAQELLLVTGKLTGCGYCTHNTNKLNENKNKKLSNSFPKNKRKKEKDENDRVSTAKIQKIREEQIKEIERNKKNPNCFEYWLERGLCIDSAKEMVKPSTKMSVKNILNGDIKYPKLIEEYFPNYQMRGKYLNIR